MILFGASGHAKVIIEILESRGITDITLWDSAEKPPIWHFPVGRPDESWTADSCMIVSIGVNAVRKKVVEEWQDKLLFGTALHAEARISRHTLVREGTVVMAGVTINADVEVGRHCIINTNASVDHDCELSDFVHISPNASLCGGVTVGEGSHIGAGATIIPGVKIGQWCTIGAGAVIIRDVPDFATVVGNPGRILHTRNSS